MASATAYPHIEKSGAEPARLKRLPRIRVAQIAMDYLAHGWSPDEICRNHPHLLPVEVYAAMAYYLDHQAEIDAEIRAELDELARRDLNSVPSAFATKMRARGLL